MVKKSMVISVVVLAMMMAGSAFANQNNCGCGLGTAIWGEQDGLLMQLLIVTVNVSTGSQISGITSGTLGCEPFNGFVSLQKVDTFVAANMDNLSVDIAFGGGETVAALAEILQIPAEQRDAFYIELQQNFDQIFVSADVTSEHVAQSILDIVETI